MIYRLSLPTDVNVLLLNKAPVMRNRPRHVTHTQTLSTYMYSLLIIQYFVFLIGNMDRFIYVTHYFFVGIIYPRWTCAIYLYVHLVSACENGMHVSPIERDMPPSLTARRGCFSPPPSPPLRSPTKEIF